MDQEVHCTALNFSSGTLPVRSSINVVKGAPPKAGRPKKKNRKKKGISSSAFPSVSLFNRSNGQDSISHAVSCVNLAAESSRKQTSENKIDVIGTRSTQELPYGIVPVCQHFLSNIWMTTERLCNACENRQKGVFAFFNKKSKMWIVIRPRPANIKAYRICSSYEYPQSKCPAGSNCTFAHGKEELYVWTMDRVRENVQLTKIQVRPPGVTSKPQKSNYSFRSPPPGVMNGAFGLCEKFNQGLVCPFDKGCTLAHGKGELQEWMTRWKEQQSKLPDTRSVGKLMDSSKKEIQFVDSLPDVTVTSIPTTLAVSIPDDGKGRHRYDWLFELRFKPTEAGNLKTIALLHRYHHQYRMEKVSMGYYTDSGLFVWFHERELKGDSTVECSIPPAPHSKYTVRVQVKVSFESTIYGTFVQAVLFDFGRRPRVLVQRLNIDVDKDEILKDLLNIRNDIFLQDKMWDDGSYEVVRMEPNSNFTRNDKILRNTYKLPQRVENVVSAQILKGELNRDNYKRSLHQLLFAEEMFMRKQLSRFSLKKAKVRTQRVFVSKTSGLVQAVDNTLYGMMTLDNAVIPDETAGRIFRRNVHSLLLRMSSSKNNRVYETLLHAVEDDEKCLVVLLSSAMVAECSLWDEEEIEVDAQFQVNRLPFCEMHESIDRLKPGHLDLLFPQPKESLQQKRMVCQRWNWVLDRRLNEKQGEIISAIVDRGSHYPLVVFGPFGAGKTFTLNHAVQLIVKDKIDCKRILLCTHSNRAADIHVELLDEFLGQQGTSISKPLRVYWPSRKVETASEIARKYCLIKDNTFVLPSREDVMNHRIVVITLSTARLLYALELDEGFFSHIFIDEAAQALEPEAIIPVAMAGPSTKVVFTGDHKQMSPEVYSKYAIRWGLGRSLPERLLNHYETCRDSEFKEDHVMFLVENYRCHAEILKFPSDCFYGKKLICRNSELAHPRLGPLLFYSVRVLDVREHDNFYLNAAEVSEVVKRVSELADDWPNEWGPKDLKQIAVFSAYRIQVQAIRCALRKSGMKQVTVDTIHNIQGDEFRVVFISTVRTAATCKPLQDDAKSSCEDIKVYFEFLSDPKLLNTAVTRARCMLVVVGDPVSLCSVGECQTLWKDYISRCSNRGSLYGITMRELEKALTKSHSVFPLNPDAPSFVPTSVSERQAKQHEVKNNVAAVEGNNCLVSFGESKTLKESNNCRDGLGTRVASEKLIAFGTETSGNKTRDKNECVNKKSEDEKKEEIENHSEISFVEFSGLNEEFFDDAKVDEIVRAYERECIKVLEKDNEKDEVDAKQEFPLPGASVALTATTRESSSDTFGVVTRPDVAQLISDANYEIRKINGRVEIRLVNLGFNFASSVRLRSLIATSKCEEYKDPMILRQLLRDEPLRYVACSLRISSKRTMFAEVHDTSSPDIQIKGHVRQAFDRDTVVVELFPVNEASGADSARVSKGKFLGVLEHIISPSERQFVCYASCHNTTTMLPINKSVTKIKILTDINSSSLSMYKKNDNGRLTKVEMMTRNKVLSGNYLFVVKLLKWRPEYYFPLGIIVRAIKTGRSLTDSMEALFAEYGVKKRFNEVSIKELSRKYPITWCIPESEYCSRKLILKNVFTIDSSASMDLDDAFSVEVLSNNFYKVGVHISDVSFFVQPNTALDKDAHSRCTSYYPKLRSESEDSLACNYISANNLKCIPMLPPRLSEDLCSLLPGKDRLAISLFFTFNADGEITGKPEIKRTVVNSICRLDYTLVQQIIAGSGGELESNVSNFVKQMILDLSSLARKRRRKRLGDAALSRFVDTEEDSHGAREMVEEMMILANLAVAKRLQESIPDIVPLRSQLHPKTQRVQEWLKQNNVADFSLSLPSRIQHAGITTTCMDMENKEKTIVLQKNVWSAICKYTNEGDIQSTENLLCDESNYPQLAVAHAQWMRIQQRSRINCGVDRFQGQTTGHAFLGEVEHPYYTQFTSPIRRYCDLFVHRLLLSTLLSDINQVCNTSQEDVSELCRRFTFFNENSRKFERDSKRVDLAKQLERRARITRVFVDTIDDRSIILHIASPCDNHLSSKQKRLQFSQMGPVLGVETEESGKEATLCWRFRIYKGPLSCESEMTNLTQDAKEVKQLLTLVNPKSIIIHLPAELWKNILAALKAEDREKLSQAVNKAQDYKRNNSENEQDHSMATRNPKHYHHPQNQNPANLQSIVDEHFYDIPFAISKYDVLHVQLSARLLRGLMSPDIQLLNVTPELSVCIEHHRYQLECFASVSGTNASMTKYDSIQQYVRSWKPVLEMESATTAVTDDDGFLLKGISLEWYQNSNGTGIYQARFMLPHHYIRMRQLHFFRGDFVCLKIAHEELFRMNNVKTDAKKRDGMCQESDQNTSKEFRSSWVCHCIVKSSEPHKDKPIQIIKLNFHQASTQMPDSILKGQSCVSDIELIHRSYSHRNMCYTLEKRLQDADCLVQSICMGFDPPNEIFGKAPDEVTISPFPQLDRYQEKAVKEALVKPFTMIQGPPGTGKTMTGAHIAYWFAKRNRESAPFSNAVEKKVNEQEGEGDKKKSPKAPPQVLYCGPSNKSVDVVSEYLLKILPPQKILRVYSSHYAESEFPIPNKLPIWRTSVEEVVMNDEVKNIALHHVIRHDSPQAPQLKLMEKEFKSAMLRGEKPGEREVEDYCKLIGEATTWAIQKSGAEIILCTCAVAGGWRITLNCDNIQQCIVDESGMSMEPETLVPITCSGAYQIVLIGDHKQLQPVIKDNTAKTLGLDKSMFERLAKRGKYLMLEIQYRMHSAICEFPSRHFYEGRLKTAESAKQRDLGPVRFWPSLRFNGKFLPLVFCHVEGQEQTTVISSSHSSESSKSNEKEIDKAVQVAKCLVNRYEPKVTKKDVVIISPYREQRRKLSERLEGAYKDIEVTTVAKSQGTEWEYVIISLGRSLSEEDIETDPPKHWIRSHLGFITDRHQMNVALTRAKRGLCIIGNKKLLRVSKMWSNLLQQYEENGCVVNEKEWPLFPDLKPI